jgi:hypothetical protein
MQGKIRIDNQAYFVDESDGVLHLSTHDSPVATWNGWKKVEWHMDLPEELKARISAAQEGLRRAARQLTYGYLYQGPEAFDQLRKVFLFDAKIIDRPYVLKTPTGIITAKSLRSLAWKVLRDKLSGRETSENPG